MTANAECTHDFIEAARPSYTEPYVYKLSTHCTVDNSNQLVCQNSDDLSAQNYLFSFKTQDLQALTNWRNTFDPCRPKGDVLSQGGIYLAGPSLQRGSPENLFMKRVGQNVSSLTQTPAPTAGCHLVCHHLIQLINPGWSILSFFSPPFVQAFEGIYWIFSYSFFPFIDLEVVHTISVIGFFFLMFYPTNVNKDIQSQNQSDLFSQIIQGSYNILLVLVLLSLFTHLKCGI